MSRSFTVETRLILALANEAAHNFGHAYIGTEHVLLGLVQEGSAGVADALATFQIDAATIRAEIEKLVTRDNVTTLPRTLPLTPRAQRAIDIAYDETRLMGERCVAPEHLFLGLIKEGEGVACQVLVNLGVAPTELTRAVFKTRIAQMKIVERAVRPVRASTPRKRKMRDELLMHVAAIYDQELVRISDPTAALAETSKRFGDPHELARELEDALPLHERISHYIENWFSWRAPETAAHYALRQAKLSACIVSEALLLVFAFVFARYGVFDNFWTLVRIFAAIALFTPPAQFVLTISWIKMRDAMWGTFGSRKSLSRILTYDALVAGVTMLSLNAFAMASKWNLDIGLETLTFSGAVGATAAAISLVAVWLTGPITVRDTIWKMLDVEAA